MSPNLSTISPSKLKIRIRKPLVSITSISHVKPSIKLITINLTQLFPNNCLTSQSCLIRRWNKLTSVNKTGGREDSFS